MKLSEMQDKLEELTNSILTVYEMVDAINSALEGGTKPENLCYALSGIAKTAHAASRDAQELVGEAIKMQKVLEQL